MIRKILHVDLDSFFCSVEILRQPELEGKPFIVGGGPGSRGVVASASYPARKFGVRSAMPTAIALRKCPDLIIVSSRHGEYTEYSKKVMQLLRDSAPLVEPISIDEAFLDVSDAFESGESIARKLQNQIFEELKLPTSWGVAANKLVAKIACEVGKPNGLVVVPTGKEAAFLAPLPVEMLWGVGLKTKEKLKDKPHELVVNENKKKKKCFLCLKKEKNSNTIYNCSVCGVSLHYKCFNLYVNNVTLINE